MSYTTFKDFHLWIGLILLIPIGAIATTGFLWNHEKALGIKAEKGMHLEMEHGKARGEIRPAAGSGKEFGLVIEEALSSARETWGPNVALERIEIREDPAGGMIVKLKVPEDSYDGPEEIVWSHVSKQVVAKKGDPADGYDWAKLVHELHTGKIFSKQFGFLWSDAGALALLILGATGVVLYVYPMFKKQANRKQREEGKQAKSGKADASSVNPASEREPVEVGADECK